MRECLAVVSHVLNPPVRAVFDRLRREAPPDLDLRFLLSNDEPCPEASGLPEPGLVHVTRDDIFGPSYPRKCQEAGWEMAGNLDLVFLEFARRHPGYDRIWFMEYDVHWEGNWRVFFDRFHGSAADVLATTVQRIADVPHKLDVLSYPALAMPASLGWDETTLVKAFLPICRLSRAAIAALDRAYAGGLGGHYELTVPSAALQAGLTVEDIGGDGRFVRPENRNRFYFARGSTYSHSPGSFVFRPGQTVLPRRNTLWHPVKPPGVPLWHPMRTEGGLLKTLAERAKPFAWRVATRLWFATRWRPLRVD